MKKIIAALLVGLFIAAAAYSGEVDAVVRMSQERGVVSSFSLGDVAPTIMVRPVFHNMDLDHKRAIGVAFLIHAQRQKPGAEYRFIMIRDSRNNNQVGSYDQRLGLQLKKPYK